MNRYLVDTSIWVEFFRGRSPAIKSRVSQLLAENRIVINGVVVSKLLLGARGKRIAISGHSGDRRIFFRSPTPLFQTDEHLSYFLTVLYSHPDFIRQDRDIAENGTDSGTVNGTVNPTQRKIMEEIEKTSSLTYEQLAERLMKGRTTIYRNIKKMVDLNIIKRFGSDKNGYWEVNRDLLSAIKKR